MGNILNKNIPNNNFWDNIEDKESIMRILENNLRSDFYINSFINDNDVENINDYEYALSGNKREKIEIFSEKMSRYLEYYFIILKIWFR